MMNKLCFAAYTYNKSLLNSQLFKDNYTLTINDALEHACSNSDNKDNKDIETKEIALYIINVLLNNGAIVTIKCLENAIKYSNNDIIVLIFNKCRLNTKYVFEKLKNIVVKTKNVEIIKIFVNKFIVIPYEYSCILDNALLYKKFDILEAILEEIY